MSHSIPSSLDQKMSEVDLAYRILKEKGQPMYYRTLIEEVFAVKSPNGDLILAIAAVHTQINLDTRFIYLGQGQWGLKSWVPSKNSHKKVSNITILNRVAAYDENEKADDNGAYYMDSDEHESQENWED